MGMVCAHGDLFHESVPDEWIDRVFAVMALTPQHTYQVLTKRSARMRAYMKGIPSKIPFLGRMPLERIHLEATGHMGGDGGFMDTLKHHGNIYSLYLNVQWPLPNVWLGVSAEDQARADERIPDLLATPATIRFVSAEPLLGPIDFSMIPTGGRIGDLVLCASALAREHGPELDWVIVGGESGPGARPMHPDWVRQIRDQCAAAGVPFFFKQWGSWSAVSQMSEDDIDRCYPPLRERHPDETRHCLVVQHVLHTDGSRQGIADRNAFLQGTGAMTMFEVGKKRAGRLLDGIEHNGMPQLREVSAL